MRASVTSLSKKFISTFFAATLALGLVPAAAFAVEDDGAEAPKSAESANANSLETENNIISSDSEESALIEENGDEVATNSSEEDVTLDNITGSEDAIVIPAATQRINQDMTLQTRMVAQAESTRSYFLAQTLESTRTVPIVSANLPLDTSSVDAVDNDSFASEDEEGDGSEDDPDADNPVDASFTLASYENDPAVSAEATVIGSFTYLGMTFAVEPGGESVALVAVDYAQLPEAFIEKQIIVIPDAVTADGMNNYSVTRIADDAFASLTKENANEDYEGCEALFTDEELIAEAGIDAAEVEAFLNSESDTIDIDGDGEADGPVNPLKDCTGILAVGIPASITNIGDEAFAGFDTLQYLVVSEDNPEYATFDGVLYDADLANLRLIPEGRVGAVRVAPSATDVDPEVFSHCPSVTTLVADPESEGVRFSDDGDGQNSVTITLSAVYGLSGLRPVKSDLTVLLSSLLSSAVDATVSDYVGADRFDLSERSQNSALKTSFTDDGLGVYCRSGSRIYRSMGSLKPPGSEGVVELNSGSYMWPIVACVDGHPYLYPTASDWYANGSNRVTSYGLDYALGYYIVQAGRSNNTDWTIYTYTDPPAYSYGLIGNSGVLYNGYNVTWDAWGGTVEESFNGPTMGYMWYPTKITKPSESFKGAGWFKDTTFTEELILPEEGRMPEALTGDVTYYLKWVRDVDFYYHDKEKQTVETVNGVKKQKDSNAILMLDEAVADPTRSDDWSFEGWSIYEEADTSLSKDLKSGTTLYYSKFYAQWSKSLKLDSKGGSSVTSPIIIWSSKTAPYGNRESSAALPSPTKTGYKFDGWYNDEAYTGTRVDDGTGDTAGKLKVNQVTSQDTIYAKWLANTYTVALDNQSATTEGTTSVTATYNEKMPTKDASSDDVVMPEKTGYVFGGYYSKTGGSGTKYYNADGTPTDEKWRTANDDTIYALWTAGNYTVEWKKDGSEANPSVDAKPSETVAYTSSVNLVSPYEREGYLFQGWIAPGGSTYRGYYPLSTFVNESTISTVTFKASWRPYAGSPLSEIKTTPGVYYPAGVKCMRGSTLGETTDTYTAFSGAVTIDNVSYSFADMWSGFSHKVRVGWDATYGYYIVHEQWGGNPVYHWTQPAAIDVSWSGLSAILHAGYKITWDAYGGTASGGFTGPATSSLSFPTSITPPSALFRDADWWEDQNFTVKAHIDADTGQISPVLTADATYYLKWVRDVTLYHHDKDGQTETTIDAVKKYKDSNAILRPDVAVADPMRSGDWDFQGWSPFEEAQTDLIESLTTDSTLYFSKFYAQWSKSLKLDSKGGSSVTSPMKLWSTSAAPYGNKASTEALSTPSKTGYTFAGWYDNEACTGTRVDDGTGSSAGKLKKNAITDANTIYAKWTANIYTVTLNAKGGSGGTENVTATYDADMPTDGVVMPTRSGYTFGGYYDAEEGGDQYYTAKGESTRTWDKTSDTELFAHWTKDGVKSIELADPSLETDSRTIWYWPPNGYVIDDEDSTVTVSALDKVPTVADYPFLVDYEFKGYFDGTGDDATKMIDADGTILAGAQDANTTWYAKWDRLSCAVVLDATYRGTLDVTEGTKRIDKAVFGEPFASSFTGTFVKPERTGYTFKGYYTEPNPEVATGGTYSGTCWIDGTPALLGTWAKPAGLAEKAAVTLFAAWELNDCTVVYDLRTPDDTEEVRGAFPANDVWHYGVAIPATLPTPSSGGFSRNGYQFKGWYYEKTDASGNTVKEFVSNADGTRKLEQWDQDMTSVTLKAEWEANEYVVVFDEAYPSIEGLPTPTSPSYERTFKYDAVFDVTDPTYAPYSFAGWRLKLPPNTTVAGADGTAGVHTTLSSNGKLRFTPQGDLVSQTKSAAKIAVEAVWNAPQDATYHLYYWTPGADDPAIRVVDKTYSYAETKTLGRSTYPAAVTGWNPTAGWVEVKPGNGKTGDEVARELIEAGGPAKDAPTTSSFGPRENTEKFFVFKWTAVPFSLSFKDAPDGDDDDAYVKPTDVLVNATADDGDVLSWEQACAATKTGDWQHATSMAYDVSVKSFKLPAVSRKGYDFEGWEQVSPVRPVAADPIDPKAIAEDTDLQELVFAPKFAESEYTIVFEPGEQGRATKTEHVGYTQDFTFPYPDALNTGSCFSSWEAEDGTTYMPDKTYPVAEQADGSFALSDLDTDGDKVITFTGVWLPAYNVTVPVRVTTMAIDTETGDMIAAGNSIAPALKPAIANEEYEVVSLRTEPVLDANGNAPFSGAGSGQVYLSVYADMTEPADETALLKKENVGEKGVITYTDKATSKLRTASPLLVKMGENAISFANKGADTDENALSSKYGFRTFTSRSPLYIRYGLVFDGVDPQVFDFKADSAKWTLPDKDSGNTSTTEDRQPGWSSKSAPLAKLTYTVRLVNE